MVWGVLLAVSGVWGRAPAEMGFCCILALKPDTVWQQF